MQPETLMLYKLIILYILDRVDFPMTNAQLSNFITDREYTNYFNVQQVLADLTDDGYITLDQTRNAAFYRITPDGHEALSFFYKNISRNIRDDIDMYLSEQQYSLREESSNVADYHEERKGEFVVELKVVERDTTVVEIRLAVPSKENAETICRNWRKKNADIYAYVLTSLLGDQPDPAESTVAGASLSSITFHTSASPVFAEEDVTISVSSGAIESAVRISFVCAASWLRFILSAFVAITTGRSPRSTIHAYIALSFSLGSCRMSTKRKMHRSCLLVIR